MVSRPSERTEVASERQQRPLGARADALLTAAQLRGLQVLQDYDLRVVRDRILRDPIWPPALVDLLIFEFRRYLGLRLVLGHSVPMLNHLVDEIWHTCLLFTRLYADLCEQAFGTFVHHDPAVAPWTDVEARWQDFVRGYEELYGPPGADLHRPGTDPVRA